MSCGKSVFFRGVEGKKGKILEAPNRFTEKNNYKLMDIRFETDMYSTKDTKYIFNNSDKLQYILHSKFIIFLFA